MKQYVLDESPSADASSPEDVATVQRPTLPPQPWPWRALLVLAIVEPLALGAATRMRIGIEREVEPAEPSTGPATIAAFALPATPGQGAAAAAGTAADAQDGESRIAFEHGKYVIHLRATDIGPALAMLADATKATVRGAEVLSRQPTQLSRSAVVATPAEAWQAVLGDVANFAISCTQKGCAVFVTAVAKDDARSDARPAPLAPGAPAFKPANVESGAEMPSVDPLAAARVTEVVTSANRVLTPVARQAPENGGESD